MPNSSHRVGSDRQALFRESVFSTTTASVERGSEVGYEASTVVRAQSGFAGQFQPLNLYSQESTAMGPVLQPPRAILQGQPQGLLPQKLPLSPGPPLPQPAASAPGRVVITSLESGGFSTSAPVRQILANDFVMVQLEARGWVVGLVIAVVKAVDMVTNWGYRVRYKVPGVQVEQIENFPLDRVRSFGDR